MQTLDSIEVFELVKECRTCLSTNLQEIVNLGLHPLANSLLNSPYDEEIVVPLVLIRCDTCTTIQLSVNVNPKLMFQDYLWVTGTTQTARNHCKNLAKQISEKLDKKEFSALEIGSNDGTLLTELVANGAKEVIGVDPAQNLQPRHLTGPIRLIEGFFSDELMETHKRQIPKVDLVVARNVLSHVPNLNDVMQGIDKIISDDGLIVIEFHEASRILSELHYDSIYHEHTFYHSIRSIQAALSQISFNVFDISNSPISGGSFIIFASKDPRKPSAALLSRLEEERNLGVYEQNSWIDFGIKVQEHLSKLRKLLQNEKDSNWVAFGASARSSTLLNSIGKISEVFSYIADNNELKQGKYSPGLRIPINSPHKAIDAEVEKIFICAFNFEAEIVKCLQENLNWTGEVVLPFPGIIRRYEI